MPLGSLSPQSTGTPSLHELEGEEMAEPVTRTVQGIVMGKTKTGQDYTIEIDISEFGKFPTKPTHVAAEIADQLQVGFNYTVLVKRGGLKVVNGVEKSGQYPSDFFWELLRVKPAEDDTETPPREAPSATESPSAFVDPTRVSIERQTALKAAVEFAGHQERGIYTELGVMTLAQDFYDWIHSGVMMNSTPEEEPHPVGMPF